MTKDQQIDLLEQALRAIANCSPETLEEYVAKVDAIAVEALVMWEVAQNDA